MNTASTLLKYRLKSLQHASGARGGQSLAAGALVIALILAATGWLAQDTLIESSTAWTAQMGRVVMLPGLRALEVAFWATALLAAIQGGHGVYYRSLHNPDTCRTTNCRTTFGPGGDADCRQYRLRGGGELFCP